MISPREIYDNEFKAATGAGGILELRPRRLADKRLALRDRAVDAMGVGLARALHRARSLLNVAIALILWTLAGPTLEAQARVTHICWIEHVQQSPYGVEIYFMQEKTRVLRNRAWEDMPLASITIDGKETAYRRASALVGEELFLSNTPEDGCSIKVAIRGGTIGVIADAYTNLPGLPRATSTKFIPAAPRKP